MALYAELFDGTRLEFPDNTDPAVIDRVAREETAKRQPKGESGFIPAVKASTQSLLGEAALLGGKLGILSPEEAQKKFEAREAEARRIFAPTENWSDGAFTKFKELLGGSLPYMAAPLAAAGAVAAARRPRRSGPCHWRDLGQRRTGRSDPRGTGPQPVDGTLVKLMSTFTQTLMTKSVCSFIMYKR